MALGDLSPDQQRYIGVLAAETGLDPGVATAWVGLESGWGVTKGGSNYLNIGPGFGYPDTRTAAMAAADLITTSSNYSQVKAAVSGEPTAQIAAIQSSPWDCCGYGTHPSAHCPGGCTPSSPGTLATVYDQLKSSPRGPSIVGQIESGVNAITGGVPEAVGGGAVAAAGGLRKFASGGWEQVALKLLFVTAALGLIGLGLARMFPGATRTITSSLRAAA